MKLLEDRKGITPVIAIVLLLMVTVGAVGVVYTQFQSLVGNPGDQIDDRQRNRATDISIVRGKTNDSSSPQDGVVVLEIENTGSVARNTTSFDMRTGSPSTIPGSSGDLCTEASNSSIIDPGDVLNCHTGVDFPQATNEVEFTIGLAGSGKDWSYTCRPQTSDAFYC